MTKILQQPFKICPMCAKNWRSMDVFISDPELEFNGYQANFGIMNQGLFYFTHINEACGSTMVLKAEKFFSLYQGERFTENKQHTETCTGKCLDRNRLDRCQAHCEFAFVREISQIIKDQPCSTR